MNAPLIGLTGHAGSGKDSCAAALAAGGWKSIAFADALRVEVAAAFHIDIRELTERASKEQPRKSLAVGNAENASWLRFASMHGHSLIEPRSPRWTLQRWGEFRRTSDALYWVRHVAGWVKHQRAHGAPGLVVTDVRFPNEALAIRGLAGHLVRVHRPGHVPHLAADTAAHESERHEQIRVDADISNGGTLLQLSAEVCRVVSALVDAQPGAAQ